MREGVKVTLVVCAIVFALVALGVFLDNSFDDAEFKGEAVRNHFNQGCSVGVQEPQRWVDAHKDRRVLTIVQERYRAGYIIIWSTE